MPTMPPTVPHVSLCFLALLGAVIVVGLLWSISIDVDRLADAVERLAGKERRR